MDSAASAAKIVFSGTRTCEGLLSCLDSYKEHSRRYKTMFVYTRALSRVRQKVAILICQLMDLVNSVRLRHIQDQETARLLSICLSGCHTAFLELAKILEDLLKLDGDPLTRARLMAQMSIIYPDVPRHGEPSRVESIVAKIQERLKPALYALEQNQADANNATTSGFEKERPIRYRPSAQLNPSHASSPAIGSAKTLPCEEEGELADALRYADLEPHKEHNDPRPHTPGAGGQRLAEDSSATVETAYWRRVPFCYLLAALGLVFILSSFAVGMYYSIEKDAMGDGFTTAGYMLAVGTLVVTPPAAYHYQHCRCWRRYPKNACPEGEV